MNWGYLSENPSAINILLKNKDKIVWAYFCKNPNPLAIKFLQQPENIKYINWWNLSKNPSAMCILKKYPEYIHYDQLSSNPAIFEYDYTEMKNKMWENNGIGEQLMKVIHHPKNAKKWRNDWQLIHDFIE